MTSESRSQEKHITICVGCRRGVFQIRSGAWYHRHNCSTACYPGDGSGRRARPREITVKER
jgi:hypothetical protein